MKQKSGEVWIWRRLIILVAFAWLFTLVFTMIYIFEGNVKNVSMAVFILCLGGCTYLEFIATEEYLRAKHRIG